MKSIFDQTTRDELIARINSLNENSKPAWGKMSVYQMLKHCTLWEEMLLGKRQYRQSFLGRLFGKMALKDMLKDEPMKPNLPTVPSFKISGDGDVSTAKAEWVALIKEHASKESAGFVHPFFGKLTADQAGCMAYKHIDHHLRQFNS
ncbi:DUF1569 domain-containing protein [Segetibacter aerophilus]|uniref:DinB-like domain-containing protein n=1 Tax=Segetibacter aerophilus TaxID=670293 RepID=A0A512BJW0_9BACT|nr:DUF1569 domain-containing protein [Segetibacter aerophilus]GEO12246.1 hypothetical protein SAE01_47420 [Segetibacter aerophilus]